MMLANCVLNVFQPRYTLPMWELTIVSATALFGQTIECLFFSSAARYSVDGRRDVCLQSRLFTPLNQSLRRAAPTETGSAEIVGDDFPILHAMALCAFTMQRAT